MRQNNIGIAGLMALSLSMKMNTSLTQLAYDVDDTQVPPPLQFITNNSSFFKPFFPLPSIQLNRLKVPWNTSSRQTLWITAYATRRPMKQGMPVKICNMYVYIHMMGCWPILLAIRGVRMHSIIVAHCLYLYIYLYRHFKILQYLFFIYTYIVHHVCVCVMADNECVRGVVVKHNAFIIITIISFPLVCVSLFFLSFFSFFLSFFFCI